MSIFPVFRSYSILEFSTTSVFERFFLECKRINVLASIWSRVWFYLTDIGKCEEMWLTFRRDRWKITKLELAWKFDSFTIVPSFMTALYIHICLNNCCDFARNVCFFLELLSLAMCYCCMMSGVWTGSHKGRGPRTRGSTCKVLFIDWWPCRH